MGGKRIAAAVLVAVGAGLLTGCCLFSGNPTVTLLGPTSATVGQQVTFVAQVQGGQSPYTYTWVGAMGQGAMATATFQSPGPQMVSVTVTDNCGKIATTAISVTVTGEDGGGGNLSGMWNGTIFDNTGANVPFALQIRHVGTSVTATVTVDFATAPGSGSYAAGRFMLQFQWPRTTTLVTLDGTYNPYANELSGDWLVGGIRIGTWRVMRNEI